MIDLEPYLYAYNWSVRARFLDSVDRAGGSSLSILSSSSFLLTIGLLFPPGGLAVTLMVMLGTELDAPNVKLLFVTVESMYVTCEAAASSCEVPLLCSSSVSGDGRSLFDCEAGRSAED